MKTKMIVSVFLSCGLFLGGQIFAQDGSQTIPVKKGLATVKGQKIPVFPGVTEISSEGADKAVVRISYDVKGGNEKKIAGFYSGKRIFGVKVGKFTQGKFGGMSHSNCNKKSNKGISISFDSAAKPEIVIVNVSNVCN